MNSITRNGFQALIDFIVVLEQGTRITAGLSRELGASCEIQATASVEEVLNRISNTTGKRLLICDAATLPEETASIFQLLPKHSISIAKLVLLQAGDRALTPLLLRLDCLACRFHPISDQELGQLCRNLLKLQKS